MFSGGFHQTLLFYPFVIVTSVAVENFYFYFFPRNGAQCLHFPLSRSLQGVLVPMKLA